MKERFHSILNIALSLIRCLVVIAVGLVLIITCFLLCFTFSVKHKVTICDIQSSPNNEYELILMAIGEPEWPFGPANGRLVLVQDKKEISSTSFSIRDDGACISEKSWKVQWFTDHVHVVLSGSEQSDEKIDIYFEDRAPIAPFPVIGTPLGQFTFDAARIIQDFCFEVEIAQWGEVTFISYLHGEEVNLEDVSFLLIQNDTPVYIFPPFFENNSTQKNGGIFDSIQDIAIKDINGDNLEDVIALINYVTGAGPQGMLPRTSVRIYIADQNGYNIDERLMEQIARNIDESELSIFTILTFLEKK